MRHTRAHRRSARTSATSVPVARRSSAGVRQPGLIAQRHNGFPAAGRHGPVPPERTLHRKGSRPVLGLPVRVVTVEEDQEAGWSGRPDPDGVRVHRLVGDPDRSARLGLRRDDARLLREEDERARIERRVLDLPAQAPGVGLDAVARDPERRAAARVAARRGRGATRSRAASPGPARPRGRPGAGGRRAPSGRWPAAAAGSAPGSAPASSPAPGASTRRAPSPSDPRRTPPASRRGSGCAGGGTGGRGSTARRRTPRGSGGPRNAAPG